MWRRVLLFVATVSAVVDCTASPSKSVTGVAVFYDNGSNLIVNFVTPDTVQPEVRARVQETIQGYVRQGAEVMRPVKPANVVAPLSVQEADFVTSEVEGDLQVSNAVQSQAASSIAAIIPPQHLQGNRKSSVDLIQDRKQVKLSDLLPQDIQTLERPTAKPQSIEADGSSGISHVALQEDHTVVEETNNRSENDILHGEEGGGSLATRILTAEGLSESTTAPTPRVSIPPAEVPTDDNSEEILILPTEPIGVGTTIVPTTTDSVGTSVISNEMTGNSTHHIATMRSTAMVAKNVSLSENNESRTNPPGLMPIQTTLPADAPVFTKNNSSQPKSQDANDRSARSAVSLSACFVVAIVSVSFLGM